MHESIADRIRDRIKEIGPLFDALVSSFDDVDDTTGSKEARNKRRAVDTRITLLTFLRQWED